jgi:hypothetical protein
MRYQLLSVSALLAVAVAAYAQNPAIGTWKGEAQMPRGPQAVTLIINADGTGSFSAGDHTALSGIAIEGNSIRFTFKPTGAGGAVTMSMAGEVNGDTLTLVGTVVGGGTGPPLVLSRQP